MLYLLSNYPNICKSFNENGYHTIERSKRYYPRLWSYLVIEPVMMKSIKSRGGLTGDRKMSESVRHQWVDTNHACDAIHDAMTKITNLSEQYVATGKTRKERDYKHLLTRYEWLSPQSPFDAIDDRLRPIPFGITVPDNESLIKCDNTDRIGEAIHKGLNGISLYAEKIKSKSKVQSTDSLYNTVVIKEGKYINLNSTALFIRLTAVACREYDMEKLFKYAMTAIPMSLFKDGIMGKLDKAALPNHLITPPV